MSFEIRKQKTLFAVTILVGALCVMAARSLPLGGGTATARAASPSLGRLNSELSRNQSEQQRLSASIAGLNGMISSLDAQIALVQSREAAVRAALQRDQLALAATQSALVGVRAEVVRLRAVLAHDVMILERQLVSNYESDQPDIVSVVLDAHGFQQLLEQLNFVDRAEQQQQTLISATRAAKKQATDAAARLARLEARERQITDATAVQARALAGMNALLQSRQVALADARAAQQAALAAGRQRGVELQAAITRVQAQQAAAARAAALATAEQSESASGSPSGSAGAGAALGPSGGWVIPYAIVLCESGGQNLPPNSAGASGYYQIIPSTWRLFGGTGPAAYLTSKAEQDAVAARIWNGGAGSSNWVCAGIVGID
ncbi:MAG: transglycosylase family protein [Solirubrobacteraceae bacterium]